jgi:hypothetical protein
MISLKNEFSPWSEYFLRIRRFRRSSGRGIRNTNTNRLFSRRYCEEPLRDGRIDWRVLHSMRCNARWNEDEMGCRAGNYARN